VVAGPAAPLLGVDSNYAPEYDRLVLPGELTPALLSGSPEGTRFALAAGVHRLTVALTPRPGQQLLGQPGAILNGSAELSGWTSSDGAWYVGGQTQRLGRVSAPGYDVCLSDAPTCNLSEDVFLDNHPLKQVPDRAALAAGTFWFDYSNSQIWLGEDPTGKVVETTVAPGAVVNGNRNVVRNLVVEKFGNALQLGAVSGVGLTIENCVVQQNHGRGITTYGGVVRANRVLSNGQMGLGGGGSGLVVEDNEIAYNNALHVNPDWEAGGSKWARATDLLVRRNWSHHNWGSGLTTDIDNLRTTYSQNLVEDNGDMGIMHEISYDAVIRDNVIRRNGQRSGWFPSRVGINVTSSSNVQVFGNAVAANTGGGVLGAQDSRGNSGGGAYGPWQLRNLSVHENAISAVGAGTSFAWQNGIDIHKDVSDRLSYYTAKGNTFSANSYKVPSTSGLWFVYTTADGSTTTSVPWSEWRNRQDGGSTLD
jgi:hypothetical protein